MYVKVDGNNVKKYSIAELKRDNPNVSFPKKIPVERLAEFGVFVASDTPVPSVDKATQKVADQGIQNVNGAWMQTWSVEEKTEQEKQAYLSTKRQEMVVTMRQARLALLEVNKLSLVDDAINLIPEPDHSKIKIEWEYASTVERTSPWMSTMASALGLSDTELDQLFESAKNL